MQGRAELLACGHIGRYFSPNCEMSPATKRRCSQCGYEAQREAEAKKAAQPKPLPPSRAELVAQAERRAAHRKLTNLRAVD